MSPSLHPLPQVDIRIRRRHPGFSLDGEILIRLNPSRGIPLRQLVHDLGLSQQKDLEESLNRLNRLYGVRTGRMPGYGRAAFIPHERVREVRGAAAIYWYDVYEYGDTDDYL